MRQGNLMKASRSFGEFTWVTSIDGMVCQQRFQFAADCILPEGENHKEKIQRGQFDREIPNGLTNEEKQKEQKHPRVRPEEKKEIDHGSVRLPVAVLKRLRHTIDESPARGLFQAHDIRAQHLLFGDITNVELEQ